MKQNINKNTKDDKSASINKTDTTTEISAGILSGGKSSRMGTNKAYLSVGSETFLKHTIRILNFCPDIQVSVDDANKYPDIPLPLVEDEKPEYGPVEGIYQLLRHVYNPACFILAADMPLMDTSLLLAMKAALGKNDDCLIVCDKEHLHPLCGIYKKTILPVLYDMRREEIHKIRPLFSRVKTRYADVRDLGFSSRLLTNVNTMQEYLKL